MSKLSLSVKKDPRGTVVTLGGSLDAETAPQFASKINSIIEEGASMIVCNLKELSYIASAGLGVIISANESLRKKKGAIRLSEMNEKIFKIFKMLGFSTLFDIFDSNEDALKGK
jgi:anti-sigma B factor antagonist